jgi:hypothetical protein
MSLAKDVDVSMDVSMDVNMDMSMDMNSGDNNNWDIFETGLTLSASDLFLAIPEEIAYCLLLIFGARQFNTL